MFEKAICVPFEGHDMPVPQDYDLMLKILYGDYMKLPPVEEQVHKHECVYLDLNNSYIKYRGKYYPKSKDED